MACRGHDRTIASGDAARRTEPSSDPGRHTSDTRIRRSTSRRPHVQEILDIFFEDSQRNVYAGELEGAHQLRPPPSRQDACAIAALTVCRCWELRLKCAVVTPEGTGCNTGAQCPRLLAGFKSGACSPQYRLTSSSPLPSTWWPHESQENGEGGHETAGRRIPRLSARRRVSR
jgi:hypothetical protein